MRKIKSCPANLALMKNNFKNLNELNKLPFVKDFNKINKAKLIIESGADNMNDFIKYMGVDDNIFINYLIELITNILKSDKKVNSFTKSITNILLRILIFNFIHNFVNLQYYINTILITLHSHTDKIIYLH